MNEQRGMGAVVPTFTCVHCGEDYAGTPEWGQHRTGPQRRLQSCATEPYGFRAHAEGTPCNPVSCIGQTREVASIARDQTSVVP